MTATVQSHTANSNDAQHKFYIRGSTIQYGAKFSFSIFTPNHLFLLLQRLYLCFYLHLISAQKTQSNEKGHTDSRPNYKETKRRLA